MSSEEARPKKRKRPSLMESYGAFSSTHLQEISAKIKTVTDSTESTSPRGVAHSETHGEAHSTPRGIPLGHIVQSPRESPSLEPSVTPSHSSPQSPRGEVIVLTLNQALLYNCLRHINGGFTTLARVATVLGASVDTLRSCLRKLRKVGFVTWHAENIAGQNGMRVSATHQRYTLRGNQQQFQNKLAQIDYDALAITQTGIHHSHQADHQVKHQADHQVVASLCSSSKDLLLQGLIFEGAFSNLNPRSLLPHLDKFEDAEDVQDFLDRANACVSAASEGRGLPIKNPQGFLFAQLKAGYINPPEGYKSRKLVAEEMRTRALQAELEEIQKQKAEQERLRFEIFKAKLTEDDSVRLDEEARKKINRKSGVSIERQIEVNKEDILKQWFEQKAT